MVLRMKNSIKSYRLAIIFILLIWSNSSLLAQAQTKPKLILQITVDQNNSRFGFAIAYKVAKRHAIKIAYTSGVSTRYRADFNSVILAYQYMWFDNK